MKYSVEKVKYKEDFTTLYSAGEIILHEDVKIGYLLHRFNGMSHEEQFIVKVPREHIPVIVEMDLIYLPHTGEDEVIIFITDSIEILIDFYNKIEG